MITRILSHLRAFVSGMREFRHACTTHFDDWELRDSYDSGREMAHRLTFRRWDC